MSPLFFALGPPAIILLVLTTKHFFPTLSCPYKAEWNINCPGCGGTRATLSLLSGNIYRAFSLNPLVATGVIVCFGYTIYSVIYRITKKNYHQPNISLYHGIFIICLIIGFAIYRNL